MPRVGCGNQISVNMKAKSGLADAPAKKFQAQIRPGSARVTTIGKMFETALQQMFGAYLADGGRIRHHVDHVGNFSFAVSNDHGGDAQGRDFLQLVHIPKDDSVHVQRLKLGPGLFQTSRFPVKRPGAVMMRASGNSA